MIKKARKIPWDAVPVMELHVTLGCVRNGKITFVQSVADKCEMILRALRELPSLSDFGKDSAYFLAWTGKWRTDLFKITKNDLIKMAKLAALEVNMKGND